MSQTYHHRGFEIAVAVENDLGRQDASGVPARVGYVSTVTISRAEPQSPSSPRCTLADRKERHLRLKTMRS